MIEILAVFVTGIICGCVLCLFLIEFLEEE